MATRSNQYNNMMRLDQRRDSGYQLKQIYRTVEQLWKKSINAENAINVLEQTYTNKQIDTNISKVTPVEWTYATEAARLAAVGFIATDVYKYAYQTDNATTWMLLTATPATWVAVETDKPHRDYIDFDETPSTTAERRLQWDNDDGTFQFGMPGGEVNQQIGLEGLRRCTNKTGVTIPNGKYVYVTGAQGNRLTIDLADNTDADKIYVLGMTTEDIPNNRSGFVALWGDVRGSEEQPVDTSSCPDGSKLYLSTGGGFTNIHPTGAIDAVVIVGRVRTSHATDGVVAVDRPSPFTIGNSFNGTMRQSIINKNTGSGAGVGFTAVNDEDHWMTVGIGGSNNTTFPDTTILYGGGYGDNYYAVDGAKSHKFYTDPTDSHNNSSLSYKRFEIASGGILSVGASDYEELIYDDDDIPNKKYVDDGFSNGGSLTGFEKSDSGEPPTDSVVAYNTGTRTITLNPTGTYFNYWLKGKKYKITTEQSATHPDATGSYFFYWDKTNSLTFSTTPWDIFEDVPISYVYYNATLGDGFFFEERHGSDRSRAWHYAQHNTVGTFWHKDEGIALQNYTLQPAAPANSDNQFNLTSGEIHDEDIANQISATNTGSYYIFRRDGASGVWTWTTETVPLLASGTYMEYNEFTGGVWTTTEGTNGDYINAYVVSVPIYGGITTNIVIMDQTSHSNLADAESESAASLELGDFVFQELIFAYKLTFRLSASYSSATGRARIEAVEDTRLSTTRSIISSSPSNSHNSLGGLEGGAAGEYYHLTTAQHSGLTTSISADSLHSHDQYEHTDENFTGTLTGVTTTVTGTIYYTVNNSVVTLSIPYMFGTSNTTSCTITGMPAAIKPSGDRKHVLTMMDNGIHFNDRISFGVGGVIQMLIGNSAVGFTASGAKGILATTIQYRLS